MKERRMVQLIPQWVGEMIRLHSLGVLLQGAQRCQNRTRSRLWEVRMALLIRLPGEQMIRPRSLDDPLLEAQ